MNKAIDNQFQNEDTPINVKTEVESSIINNIEVEKFNFKGDLAKVSNDQFINYLSKIEKWNR